MKMSEIFKRAKPLIENGNTRYICNAVSCIGLDKSDRDKAKAWVRELLRGHYTYEDWLRENRFDYYAMLRDARELNRNSNEGRLQWLDWMISHWEKIESEEERRYIE